MMTTATETQGFQHPGSPPTKASLTSWWDKFKGKGTKKDDHKENPGIFGVPLQESIKYARVAISLTDANGNSFIYGYIPIVIAKCGVFLKDKATDVEGIFRLNGSAKRIKDLQVIFNAPNKFGKGLDWAGYTVHDAANILRRYLNQLPEPIIPLEFYQRFREPLLNPPADLGAAIAQYQQLISELPPLNRQLLLYILDLLAVFASKSNINLMPAPNLAAIFQPGLISHPEHDMSPSDYRVSQDVLVFLIDNQDHFLLGMRGQSDEEALQRNASTADTSGPKTQRSKTVDRHPSNGSERKQGGIRRHTSVSSKHSMSSPSPGIGSGSLSRSNTLPSSTRSPASASTFRNPHSPLTQFAPSHHSSGVQSMEKLHSSNPITPSEKEIDKSEKEYFPPIKVENPITSPGDATQIEQGKDLVRPNTATSQTFSQTSSNFETQIHDQSSLCKSESDASRGSFSGRFETLNLNDTNDVEPKFTRSRSPTPQNPLRTPTKDRSFPLFSSKSPGSDSSEKRNKLRKRNRIPGSANQSAESSTTSLNGSTAPSPSTATHPHSLPVPPLSNPETHQPPLLPINEPASAISTSQLEAHNSDTRNIHIGGTSRPYQHRRLPSNDQTASSAFASDFPRRKSSNHMTVPVSSNHAHSTSTASLVQAGSPSLSATSSVSSHSSNSEAQRPVEQKKRSIWRMSAQKLNLGGPNGHPEKSSHSPPPPNTHSLVQPTQSQNIQSAAIGISNQQHDSLSTHSQERPRNRSQSVDDRSAELRGKSPSSSSSIPQRGASASGHGSPDQASVSGNAISWIQKKLNERSEKKEQREAAAATNPQSSRPMSPPTHTGR